MDYLINILEKTPYILRILASLIFILSLNRVVKKLWLAVLAGILLLAIWSGHGLSGTAIIAWNMFISPNNIFLIIVVFQVIILSSQMSKTGAMTDLVQRMHSSISARASLGVLPALIGLLPMPGGALFSAPLVEDSDPGKELDPVLKTDINYWFRHIWEYWWPLYPGVLLALEMTKLPVITFMILQLPLCLLSILTGYFFLLRKARLKGINNGKIKFSILYLLKPIAPIVLIIVSYALIRTLFPFVSQWNKYLPMSLGIFLAILLMQKQRPLGVKDWKEIIFSWKSFVLLFLVILVRIYGAFVEARLPDGSFLMNHIQAELNTWQIPILLVIILVPFISGLTTGIAIAFVGASFPVIMSLLGNTPDKGIIFSTVMLAFASGYLGMLLSPVHICLIVTNEFFNTRVGQSILSLIPLAVTIITGAMVYFIILRNIF